MSMVQVLRGIIRGVQLDRALLDGINPTRSSKAGLLSPTIRAAVLFRLAASGGTLGKLSRSLLMVLHGCDCSEGAKFDGAVYFPHPIGIVIGAGARIGHGAWIYQNVTVGAGAHGRYPGIGDRVRIYPGALIAGGVTLGTDAVVGAGVLLRTNVSEGQTVRAPWTELMNEKEMGEL